jgi:molecular chaperone DnaJ
VLSDPKRRAEYDAGGFAGFAHEDLFAGVDLDDLLGGLGLGWGGGLFERLFGGRRGGPRRGADLEAAVEIPLARVLTGGEERVHLRRPARCSACGGSGAKAGTAPRRCEACQGTGQRVTGRREGGVTIQTVTTCPDCRGQGRLVEHPCPECGGAGEVEREETLTVTIPPGVEDGIALRLPGKGLPGPQPAGRAGDAFVIVRVASDPRFERDGADLWRVETIPVADAVLGTTLEVPTLEGSATVTVPPGTQPEAVLRLKQRGLPRFERAPRGRTARGDLYVRLRVQVPERLTDEERTLWQRLRAGEVSTSAGRAGASRGAPRSPGPDRIPRG